MEYVQDDNLGCGVVPKVRHDQSQADMQDGTGSNQIEDNAL